MALCSDPQGADFGLVQPGNYPMFAAAGEPFTMRWAELVTPDVEAARRFYEKVFAWRAVEHDGDGSSGADWTAGGEPVAGLARMDGTWPAQRPAVWIPHIQVTDCDASAAGAAESGGTVVAARRGPARPPIPLGRPCRSALRDHDAEMT
ncbi:hypothetical protein F8568_011285 [Actinomadura sp. LD22]|uniref:VOC domain-containing protein n=1 Tax=Actinomadura physcomitrii TaxID=2650748 RepID=A0A6I4MAB5_9ACTN|nr:VOC family protein [Actinomadura physcomitrii]MWA00957.1 hypothetical protein [Actinomadura physcomitrii]